MCKTYDERAIRARWRQITLRLIARGMSITTMESATSGQLASLITDTEGASAIMKGAFVTYSNEAKILQGVPAEVIETYSVYSRETARAMAEAARRTYGADVAVGVTGTMGNVDPANAAASVPGQVYFAIALKDATRDFFVELPPQPTRLGYKLAVADEIASELEKLI